MKYRLITKRFFDTDTSLGDKHFIIGVIKDSIQELSDNPNKYKTESFNEFE